LDLAFSGMLDVDWMYIGIIYEIKNNKITNNNYV